MYYKYNSTENQNWNNWKVLSLRVFIFLIIINHVFIAIIINSMWKYLKYLKLKILDMIIYLLKLKIIWCIFSFKFYCQ